MHTWIALLRGINVGGKNILPMAELRTLLEGLGLKNIRTYIQSGNCIFESTQTSPTTLANSIGDCIENKFGFRPQVLAISKSTLTSAISGNPYPEGIENPKTVHLYFLSEPVLTPDLSALGKIQNPSERFLLSGQVFYLYTPEGFGNSKLAARVEKCLGVPVTARNLRSAMKIADLAT